MNLDKICSIAMTIQNGKPIFTKVETGTFCAFPLFAVEDISDYRFAYSPKHGQLICLTGNIDQGFEAIGLAAVLEHEIIFLDASLVSEGDFKQPVNAEQIASKGKTVKFHLGKLLSQMVRHKFGKTHDVNFVTGDSCMFEIAAAGGTKLTVFNFNDESFGVYESTGKEFIVRLRAVCAEALQAEGVIATYDKCPPVDNLWDFGASDEVAAGMYTIARM